MKLSEAIRLGAAISPQTFYTLRNRLGGTCALGSAAAASGISLIKAESEICATLRHMYPDLDYIIPICPVCLVRHISVGVVGEIVSCKCIDIIIHLNDIHKWTREQIADWIEIQFESGDLCDTLYDIHETGSPVNAEGKYNESPIEKQDSAEVHQVV
mgnify:CR=1 FL=1